jgi:hypothetical protein
VGALGGESVKGFVGYGRITWPKALNPSDVLKHGAWTLESARNLYQMVAFVGFYFLVLAWMASSERVRKVLTVLLRSTFCHNDAGRGLVGSLVSSIRGERKSKNAGRTRFE